MSFCRYCGNPVDEASRFCAKCGGQVQGTQQQPAPAASPTPATLPAPATSPAPAASPAPAGSPAPVALAAATPKKGLSTGAKLGIAAGVIVLICAGAAVAGIFYAAHRVSQKFHEVKAEITGGADTGSAATSTSAGSSASSSAGDPCRYLSKQDVGTAIGIEIVKTQADGDTCSYLAKGTASDMAAKHASALVGAKGGDKNVQKATEQFASTIYHSMPQDKQNTIDDGSGNVPVIAIAISDSPDAIAEMNLNAGVLKNLGGQGGDLNIGDQAFASSESLLMFRKGKKLIRMMYMTCPCATKNVVPLAKKLADSL